MTRYIFEWDNYDLTSSCSTVEQMISTFQDSIETLRTWKAAGIKLEDDCINGTHIFYTEDENLAIQFGFEEDPSIWEGEDDQEDYFDPYENLDYLSENYSDVDIYPTSIIDGDSYLDYTTVLPEEGEEYDPDEYPDEEDIAL